MLCGNSSRSDGLGGDGELALDGAIRVVDVREHAQVVCHPQRDEVRDAVPSDPLSVPRQEVEVELIHVFDHPLGALAVAVVPGAVTAALLGPEVDHGAGEVERVGQEGGHAEAEAHKERLAPVVSEVLVHPEEEELVLQERVERAESGPEDKGARPDGEATLEEVAGALLKGDSDKGVDRGCVASAELSGPRFVGVVSAASVLEGDAREARGGKGLNRAQQVLESVLVSVLLRRGRATVDVLPCRQLHTDVSGA